MRTVVCQQIVDGAINATVDDSFCAGDIRPPMIVTCEDNPPCPFWLAGEFSEVGNVSWYVQYAPVF